MKVEEEKILDVAYRLFKEKGVRSVSLQQIARVCGVGTGQLYLKFKSKKDLIMALARHIIEKKSTYLFINSSLSPSAVAELSNFFKVVEDSLQEFESMFHDVKRYAPLVLNQLNELVDSRLIPYLQANMERGLTEGFYRDAFNFDRYASTYFYVVRTVLESERNWTETKQAIAHINDIFLHGVLNAKGMRV